MYINNSCFNYQHFSNKLLFQQKQEVSQQDPITHPIFGTAPAQQYPNNNGYIDPNQNMPYNQAPPPQMFQPSPASTGGFNQPMNFNTSAINQGNFNQNALNTQHNPSQPFQGPTSQGQTLQGQTIQSQPEKPAPVQKGPIPEEHLHMKTIFDELMSKCSCAANNPVS